MKAGQTFLYRCTPGVIPHLTIALFDCDKNGDTVIVGITTERPTTDPTVKLNQTDHPWIKNPSVVAFVFAQIVNESYMATEFGLSYAKPREQASDALLARLRQGILDSPHTKRRIKEYCRPRLTQFGISGKP